MSKKKSTAPANKKEESASTTKTSLKNKALGPKAPADINVLQNPGANLNYLVINSITGPTGDKGENGKDGATGPNGENGKDGATGPKGEDGKDGVTGPKGADGTNGINGKDGVTGPKGADGTNGKDGATGPKGVDGTNGTNGKDGVTGPKGEDGKDGVTGPKGADGTNGKDGATGPKGADGTNGTNGKDGATGPKGADGTNGTNGTNGKDGVTGPKGADGTNGKDGVTGPKGADGANGTNGGKGDKGDKGDPGMEKDSIILRKTNQPIAGYTALNIVVTGNTIDGFWNECPAPNPFVNDCGIAADENSKVIYIVGGVDKNNQSLDVVQKFNPLTKSWSREKSTNEPISLCAATMFQNSLVYVGGTKLHAHNDRAQMLSAGGWTPFGGVIKKTVLGAAAVTYQGRLYLFGGREGTSANARVFPYVQMYDPNKAANPNGEWVLKKEAERGFNMATAAVFEDKIYVFGGYGTAGEPMPVMYYQPATDTWVNVIPNNTGILYGSSFMIGSTIYYIGGRSVLDPKRHQDVTGGCFSYNVLSNGTSILPFTPLLRTPRVQPFGAALGRKMLVAGGTGPTGSFNTEFIDLDEYQFYLHKKV